MLRAFLLTLFALQATHDARAARILALLPHPGNSHFAVFRPLLQGLNERGHNVTVVSFFPEAQPPPGYRDISLVGSTDIFLNALDLSILANKTYLGLSEQLQDALLMNHAVHIGLEICDKVLAWPAMSELLSYRESFDLVIVENFNSDCMFGVAHRFGAPVVGLLSHHLLPWHYDFMGVPDSPTYITPFFYNENVVLTTMQRLKHTLCMSFYQFYYRCVANVKEKIILEKSLSYEIPDIEKLAKNISVMLINVHHSLHGPQPLVPGVVEVGGIHLKKELNPLSPDLEKYLNESVDGVVLFSFGSMIRSSTMPKEKLDAFLRVLSKQKQRVIMKWESEKLEGKPDNVLLVKWLPQRELLNHPKVVAFIAHGGLLGMTEAVDAGVPMLVVPIFGDQPLNARAAETAGLATVVTFREITEELIEVALNKTLSNEMRQSARALSSVWRDRPMSPLDTAVYWTERVLRHGAVPLASPARHLPFYQRTLLDVAAVLLILFLVLILAAYLILKFTVFLLWKICTIGKNKVKTS